VSVSPPTTGGSGLHIQVYVPRRQMIRLHSQTRGISYSVAPYDMHGLSWG